MVLFVDILFVGFHPINFKTTEPIGPKFFIITQMTPGTVKVLPVKKVKIVNKKGGRESICL